MVGHLLRGHIAQHKLQAAAQHGYRHFMRVGGRQNKFHMLGRLFQRFQHGVESRFGQHVHFVDDIDFVLTGRRRILGVFQHLADVVDTGIGGGIDFQQIDKTAAVDFAATAALAARLAVVRVFTVQAFGQNPRDGGFADPAGTGEQIGMVQAAFIERVFQRFDHVFLTNQIGKVFRPPFTSEYLISHKFSSQSSNSVPAIKCLSEKHYRQRNDPYFSTVLAQPKKQKQASALVCRSLFYHCSG